ncbi:hypothetical protein QUG33_23360, partial [Citrobacter braakii]|uniref:hypothetical protein n=1 Tax=Citrobacter braakii TaxID=57706 RepID=UPI0025A1FB62
YLRNTSAVRLISPSLISQTLKLELLFNHRKILYIVVIFSSVRRYKNNAMPTYTLLRSVWGLPTVAAAG